MKLLEITGFKKVIDLLNKQRAIERVQSDWNVNSKDHSQSLLDDTTFSNHPNNVGVNINNSGFKRSQSRELKRMVTGYATDINQSPSKL